MPYVEDRDSADAASRSFLQRPILIFFAALAAVLIALSLYAQGLVVSLTGEDGKALAFATEPGDRWHIGFTHSVEKTPWLEFYRVDGAGEMTLTHTIFQSLGWGYPYSAADGPVRQTKDGRFLQVQNRHYKAVRLRVARQAMQHIYHGKDAYDLVGIFGHGSAIDIKVEHRWQYWQRKYFAL